MNIPATLASGLKVIAAAITVFGPLAGEAAAAIAANAPLGERLSVAAAKYGLSDADVAEIRAAGGEFTCPGDDSNDGARLNGWLIGAEQVITNAHGIVEGEENPGHPYLRQPIFDCYFTSFLDLGNTDPPQYVVNLNGLGAVLRRGAKAPVDPTVTFGGDVVRLRHKQAVPKGVPLAFDPTPVNKGDSLVLVSRVPTAYRSDALPGDDLIVARCTVTDLDPKSGSFSRGALTDCNGAEGMSAGMLFAHVDGKLVAKGFLVEIVYVRNKNSKQETVIGTHMLLFDDRFSAWLTGDCAFWPSALRIGFCGQRR